jgi:hypothetical protein
MISELLGLHGAAALSFGSAEIMDPRHEAGDDG